MNIETMIFSMLGLVIAALQAMVFFVLSDIKDRIVRLEKKYFTAADSQWDGINERRIA